MMSRSGSQAFSIDSLISPTVGPRTAGNLGYPGGFMMFPHTGSSAYFRGSAESSPTNTSALSSSMLYSSAFSHLPFLAPTAPLYQTQIHSAFSNTGLGAYSRLGDFGAMMPPFNKHSLRREFEPHTIDESDDEARPKDLRVSTGSREDDDERDTSDHFQENDEDGSDFSDPGWLFSKLDIH